ncbi:MAG: pilus assembly protein CpaE [Miltoncostaeaceae bacterium]|nr:pilus assembly protein CpaE [Miltoncostaeaceae bacterium]
MSGADGAAGGGPGPVVLVLGAVGGCGTTLVAGGIGLAWARSGRSACLVELDVERGDLAGDWGLPSDRTLADLAPVAGELAAGHLSQVAYPHETGLSVLLGPGQPGAGAPWSEWAGRLLAVAAADRAVVADGGSGLVGAGAAAVGAARAILVACPASVAGARRARRLGEHLEQLGAGRLARVAVRRGPRDELSPRAVGRAAGMEVAADLPWSDAEGEAISAGRWPEGRRRRLAAALAALAEVVA